MRVENGMVGGDVRITERVEMRGLYTGSVTVEAGGELILKGMVSANLVCKPGGKAQVHGFVCGDLIAEGEVTGQGMVGGKRVAG